MSAADGKAVMTADGKRAVMANGKVAIDEACCPCTPPPPPVCCKCGDCCYSDDSRAVHHWAYTLTPKAGGAPINVAGTTTTVFTSCGTWGPMHRTDGCYGTPTWAYQVDVGVALVSNDIPTVGTCQSVTFGGTYTDDTGQYWVSTNGPDTMDIDGNRCCNSAGTCIPGTPAADGTCNPLPGM